MATVLARFLSTAALALTTAHASAQSFEYFTHYDVTTEVGFSPITEIVMIENFDGFQAFTWSFEAAGAGATTRLSNPFPSDTPALESLLVGIVADLPGDAPGQEHLVLMMDDHAASNVQDIAWGTVFTTVLEEDVIDAVHTMALHLPFGDPDLEAALNTLSAFVDVASYEAHVGDFGLPGSALFTTGGSFTIVAWSDGQVIGSGVSTIEPIAVVPEPSALAMLLAGIGVVGTLARRRRPDASAA